MREWENEFRLRLILGIESNSLQSGKIEKSGSQLNNFIQFHFIQWFNLLMNWMEAGLLHSLKKKGIWIDAEIQISSIRHLSLSFNGKWMNELRLLE